VNRRSFITLLGGGIAAWPFAARAQQREKMPRVGVLMSMAADDPEAPARVSAFAQGLQELGWRDGRDVRIDYRWAAADATSFHRHAQELLTLGPDVIIASALQSVVALQQTTRTVPIVFVSVTDPVGAGLVEGLAHPGGNTTGFSLFEYSISTPVGARVDEIERGLSSFAREPNGGVIVTASPLMRLHRNLIITLVARHQLPAVYPFRYFATSGGLISYGPDPVDPYRRAATYVDRILRGEKPADLPVQAPTKYELVLNQQTAKVLGLEIPPSVLARADEVIE
jgi:putative tryptophan/tyrosine transport system substrate-binding protein